MARRIAFVHNYTKCSGTAVRSLSLSQALKAKRLDSFAPSPFSARASAIRSRTCGRQRLAFLAVSATGGARKPNPSEGAEGAPAPCTDLPRWHYPFKMCRDPRHT